MSSTQKRAPCSRTSCAVSSCSRPRSRSVTRCHSFASAARFLRLPLLPRFAREGPLPALQTAPVKPLDAPRRAHDAQPLWRAVHLALEPEPADAFYRDGVPGAVLMYPEGVGLERPHGPAPGAEAGEAWLAATLDALEERFERGIEAPQDGSLGGDRNADVVPIVGTDCGERLVLVVGGDGLAALAVGVNALLKRCVPQVPGAKAEGADEHDCMIIQC